MRFRAALTGLIGAWACALAACSFRMEKELVDELSGGPEAETQLSRAYTGVYRSVLEPRCLSCHGPGNRVDLSSYGAVRSRLGDVERAALVDRSMPPGAPLTPRETRILSRWIRSGAPELPQPGAPDPGEPGPDPSPIPLQPTFESIRARVLRPLCSSCHGPDGEAHRVPLDSREQLLDSPLDIVKPGEPENSGLWIFVTLPDEDDNRMPPTDSPFRRLTAEEIAAIETWIREGAQ